MLVARNTTPLVCQNMASSDALKSELFNLTVLDLPDQTELVNSNYNF
jgi:hypothetical protein